MLTGVIKATQYGLRTLRKLSTLPSEWEQSVDSILDRYTTLIMNRAVTKYLTTGPLHVVTNRLRSSVRRFPTTGTYILGNSRYTVIGTNVPYGKLWEEGFIGRNGAWKRRMWLAPARDDYGMQLRNELRNLGGKLGR